jgi:hypothetical protein
LKDSNPNTNMVMSSKTEPTTLLKETGRESMYRATMIPGAKRMKILMKGRDDQSIKHWA